MCNPPLPLTEAELIHQFKIHAGKFLADHLNTEVHVVKGSMSIGGIIIQDDQVRVAIYHGIHKLMTSIEGQTYTNKNKELIVA